MTVLAMSHGELSRFDTLMRVERGELRVADAGSVLGLKRRQIFRLLERLRSDGLPVLFHASAADQATGGMAIRFANTSSASFVSIMLILDRPLHASI